MKKTPELSVVIPVHNEEENIGRLYNEIREAVDPLNKDYEIIFVDDGSTDSSFECLKDLEQKARKEKNSDAHLRIIKFRTNFGQTQAMQAGFDHAEGNIIISLDGDLQNDPKDIPKVIAKLNEGYDLVCGWRKDRKDKKLTRIVPSKIANWLISKITGVPIHDNGCSLKGYHGPVIKSTKLYSEMHRFIPALTNVIGAKVAEIVVNHRYRRFGETKYGLSRIWKVLFDMISIKMLIHFYNKPGLWFAGFGFVFFLLGMVTGFIVVLLMLNGQDIVILGSVSFLFFSLFGNLILWGLLAEVFVRTEHHSSSSRKSRMNMIISE